jgi:CDP-diacylglycerol--glycerol-3-phosphate 3-phosphatidyltransferase
MTKNLSAVSRAHLARVIEPVGRSLVRAGVSADVVTVLGTLGVMVGCLGFVVRGQLLVGLVIVTLSVLTDMLDGAVARAGGGSSRFGAFLDSTMDRLSDGVIFGSLAYWLATIDRHAAAAVALLCLVSGQLVSYTKARSEGLGIPCDVGLAERSERLVLVGLGAVLWLAGVPYALDVALWLLAALSLVTVGQRIRHVWRATR